MMQTKKPAEPLDKRQMLVMMAQFKKSTQEPSEYIKYALKSEKEPNVWYILLSGFDGDENEFTYETTDVNGVVTKHYGEYLCRMEAPKNFPFDPPHFYMLTENGLYGQSTPDKDVKICISVGEYHKDQYRAALGMRGFAEQLVSGMIGWRDMGSGISILKTSTDQKREFAKRSRDYNMRTYPEIMALLEESFKTYSARWDLSKVPDQLKQKLGLVKTGTDIVESGEKPN